MNKRQIVHVLSEVRQQIRNPVARLPELFERERALHEIAGLAEKGVDLLAERFSVLFDQFRLVIERVDMAHTAGAEDEDDALRSRDERFRVTFAMQQPCERNTAK